LPKGTVADFGPRVGPLDRGPASVPTFGDPSGDRWERTVGKRSLRWGRPEKPFETVDEAPDQMGSGPKSSRDSGGPRTGLDVRRRRQKRNGGSKGISQTARAPTGPRRSTGQASMPTALAGPLERRSGVRRCSLRKGPFDEISICILNFSLHSELPSKEAVSKRPECRPTFKARCIQGLVSGCL